MIDERHFQYDPSTGKLFRIKELAAVQDSGKANRIWFGEKQRQATHIIWYLMTGNWPPQGMVVDHIDGDPTNNCWENLRLATHTENMRNTTRDSRTHNRDLGMERGVQKRGNSFLVSISGFYIGSFHTVEEANAAALAHRKDIHGSFMPEMRGRLRRI